MGLVSWIKDTYYNHKLDNADAAYRVKDISGAERIYKEILNNQPDAAEHLAKMYCEVGKSSKKNGVKEKLVYFNKLGLLHAETSFGKKQVASYLTQLVSHIIGVIKAEYKEANAVAYFSDVWPYLDQNVLLDNFVTEEYKYHKAIIVYLIDKCQISKWNNKLFSHFCDNVCVFDDYRYALSVFDRLNEQKLPVQKPYVATILNVLSELGTDAKLFLVNESLMKFKDENLINEKLSIAGTYLSEGNYNKSETVLKELVGMHASAEPRLAMLYYEESQKSRSLDCKESLILKGLAFRTEHTKLFSAKEYDTIFKKLLKAYDSLIEEYCSAGDFSNAYRLCLGLKLYSNDWLDKYAKIKHLTLSRIDSSDAKVKEISTFFNMLESEGVNIKTLQTEYINSLWNELSSAQIRLAHTLPYAECAEVLNSFISYVEIRCNEELADAIIKSIKLELITLHKEQGYRYEQDGKYVEAVNVYGTLYDLADLRIRSWCKIRSLICMVKQDNDVSEDDVRKALGNVGFAKEKKELSYRYGIWLIKHNGAKAASCFVTEFLSKENELVDICHNAYLKEAESVLAELNTKVSRLNTGEVSLLEAQNFADSLDSYDCQTSVRLTDVHNKIESLRTSIWSYILSKSFENGDYELALKSLKKLGKNWYEDDIYFRNVAIACLGMAETGKINHVNYKAIISCWLTAVYRDQLFVRSLDYTSWDNSYTFTLKNSLGGSRYDSFDSLPSNVNFDDPVDGSVVSISEVQQSLLRRFELALNDKDDVFATFYEEQKNAMDFLVRLDLDNPCIIAAPYLANNTRKCLNDIKNALDYEYDKYGGEKILKVGVLYNINSGRYKAYKEASNYADECVSAAESMSDTHVRRKFTNNIIDAILEFPELYESFTTEIQNVLTKVTKNSTSYKNVLNVFSVICSVLCDNTLSYMFGNFINQSVVSKLNDKSMDLATGLKDLVSVYNVAASCTQLKNNIGNVLEALVGRYIAEAIPSDLTTIKYVLNATGIEFEKNIADALSEQTVLLAVVTGHTDAINAMTSIPAKSLILRTKLNNVKSQIKELSVNMRLSQIVEKVNSKTMSYSLALQNVYNIYKENPDNSRVCDNLCTLIDMCIKEYIIPDTNEKSTVKSIFNKIKDNKSTTYKTCAQVLKSKRTEILNQYPWDVRNCLAGDGSRLNADGLKLKRALQLYLDLA